MQVRRFIFHLLSILTIAACSSERTTPELKLPGDHTNGRGQVIVTSIAACGFCHGATSKPSSPLSGGRVFKDRHSKVTASNITPDPSYGIGGWSVTEFMRAMRSHVNPSGRDLSTDFHTNYAWMSDADLLAVANYLRTVSPVKKEVDSRGLGFFSRNTSGLLESRLEMEGYVPNIETRFVSEYGRYLVDNVAQCTVCHTGPRGIFGSGRYLVGGRSVWVDGASKVAPDITQSKTAGIGGWGEQGILKYLKTGVTPDNHFVDPNFCPVKFYASAPDSELKAMARHLASVPASE